MYSTPAWRSANTAVSIYLEHLKNPQAKLPALHDAFKDLRSSSSALVEFHKALCEAMAISGEQFVGVKVVPPTHEIGIAFRATHSICMPLFSTFVNPKQTVFNIASDRVHFVECGLCVRLRQALPADATRENLSSSGATVAAAIELTGTRFPFYHPSFSDYAADLGGCVNVIIGKENPIQSLASDALNSHGLVLTRNEEPIQVGSGQLCDSGPVKCVNTALQYAQKIGKPLCENSLILCAGVAPRTPAQSATYMLNWGAYGAAHISLV